MQLQEAISTLRHGIDTILNCDVPYEDMDTALKFVEEKFTGAQQAKGINSHPLSDADECEKVFYMGL